MFDGNAMAAEVIKTVREFVAKATEPLLARISELEAQAKALPIQITAAKESVREMIGEQLAQLPTPKAAEVVDYARIALDIESKFAALEIPQPEPVDYDRIGKAIEEKVAALPPAKDGAPGKDADPAALADLKTRLAELDAQVKSLPVAENGEPGKDADPVDYQRIAELIDGTVAAKVKTIPAPKDGKDAAPEAVRAMVVEEAEKAVAALPKSPTSFMLDDAGELVAVYPDGETKAVGNVRGKDGARGASIMDGSVDDDGQLVLRMSDGRVINAGIVKGKDGADAEGKRGKPGRDASEIRVLPAIDEAESYPEGTYASYRGGEIRAERATDPIVDGDVIKSGWRIAREGIAEESEQTLKEGRIIERTTVYTSGRAFSRSIVTHAQIGRGVYKAGTEYDQCDVVTWDGSQWQCEHATKAEPGNGNDWRLIVKRGTPGKDAQQIKGDPGPPGRPGRDLTQLGPNGSKY